MKDLYRLQFEQAKDACFVLDLETSTFQEVNRAFEELTGWSKAEIAAGQFTSRDLVLPEDLPILEDMRSRRQVDGGNRYTIRIRRQDGEVRHVEVSVTTVDTGTSQLRAGSMRDVTQQIRLEKKLQNEIRRQRNTTFKAAQASVRIGQVLEKLRNIPDLARHMMGAPSREELLRFMVEDLTAGNKFSYERVVIFLLADEDEGLRVLADSSELQGEDITHGPGSPVGRVVQTGEPHKDGVTFITPLGRLQETFGALLVRFHTWEKSLLDENETIRTAQEDTLRTIGNLLGMALTNLKLSERLQHQALVDQLTGLHNRHYLSRILDLIKTGDCSQAPLAESDWSAAIVDVDHFKQINDTLGHAEGDEVLIQVARLLREHFADAPAICRYGGDEFIVVVPMDVPALGQTAERFRQAVEVWPWPPGHTRHPPVTVSVGIGPVAVARNPATWFAPADAALYAAKDGGRNLVRIHEPAETA